MWGDPHTDALITFVLVGDMPVDSELAFGVSKDISLAKNQLKKYSFTPEKDDYYCTEFSQYGGVVPYCNIVESGNYGFDHATYVGRSAIKLQGGKTYYLLPHDYDGNTATFNLTMKRATGQQILESRWIWRWADWLQWSIKPVAFIMSYLFFGWLWARWL